MTRNHAHPEKAFTCARLEPFPRWNRPRPAGAQVLDFLSAWLQNGREDLCQEFERQLKESYTWPPAERRSWLERLSNRDDARVQDKGFGENM